MESLFLLIPIAIFLVFVAASLFIWAVKSEQFEDLERQGMNIFLEKSIKKNNPKKQPNQHDGVKHDD